MSSFFAELTRDNYVYSPGEIARLDFFNRHMIAHPEQALIRLVGGAISRRRNGMLSCGLYTATVYGDGTMWWAKGTPDVCGCSSMGISKNSFCHERGSSMISLAASIFDCPMSNVLRYLPDRLELRASFIDRFLLADKPGFIQLPYVDARNIPAEHVDWATLKMPILGSAQYKTENGRVKGVITYYNIATSSDRNDAFLLPLTPFFSNDYGTVWDVLHFASPYPLWNLPDVVGYANATVIVAPDELVAEQVHQFIRFLGRVGDYVVTTWPGGLRKGISRIDMSPLAGRRVLIFPKHSSQGFRCADELYSKLQQAAVRSINFIAAEFCGSLCLAGQKEALLGLLLQCISSRVVLDHAQFCEVAERCFNLQLVSSEVPMALSTAQLLALPTPEEAWVLHDLISVGDRVMLYGAKGQCKTWLNLTIALSIAAGQPGLSGFIRPAMPRKVLIIDGEQSLADLQERVKKLSQGLNIDIEQLNTLSLISASVIERNIDIVDADFLKKTKDTIDSSEVIVVDNINCLHPRALQASPESAEALNGLINAWGLQGKTVIVVNHASRSGESFGTSAKEFPLDLLMRLKTVHSKAGGPRIKVELQARRLPPMSPRLFELYVDDQKAVLVGVPAPSVPLEQPETHAGLDEKSQKVLEAYQNGHTTARAIEAATGISKSASATLLKKLREAGCIEGSSVSASEAE